jgi:hypothetical protein
LTGLAGWTGSESVEERNRPFIQISVPVDSVHAVSFLLCVLFAFVVKKEPVEFVGLVT